MADPLDGMLGTIGIEIETELMPENLQFIGWTNTHDASIEIPVAISRNWGWKIHRTPYNVEYLSRMIAVDNVVLGREFYSNILLDDDDVSSRVRELLLSLYRMGENTRNQRAGLHVHVGWAYDLDVLKTTVLLNVWLESLLYHLGGMGYTYRGIENNSAYCRPITRFGPPVVDSNLGKVQMTNIESLLAAPTTKSFWNRFGGLDYLNPPKRYTPQRYMGINLFSIFLHKTLEYRMFNTSLCPEYVLAIVKLCSAITKLTMSSCKIPDEENSVYVVDNKNTNQNLLDKLLQFIKLDRDTVEILQEILDSSPVPLLPEKCVGTHLKEKFVEFDERDLEGVMTYFRKIDDYEKPAVVDIHVLEEELQNAIGRARRKRNVEGLNLRDRNEEILRRLRLNNDRNAERVVFDPRQPANQMPVFEDNDVVELEEEPDPDRLDEEEIDWHEPDPDEEEENELP